MQLSQPWLGDLPYIVMWVYSCKAYCNREYLYDIEASDKLPAN